MTSSLLLSRNERQAPSAARTAKCGGSVTREAEGARAAGRRSLIKSVYSVFVARCHCASGLGNCRRANARLHCRSIASSCRRWQIHGGARERRSCCVPQSMRLWIAARASHVVFLGNPARPRAPIWENGGPFRLGSAGRCTHSVWLMHLRCKQCRLPVGQNLSPASLGVLIN